MEIIDYEPVNLYNGNFCKIFHSEDAILAPGQTEDPTFHWHNSYEFNVVLTGKAQCDFTSSIQYAENGDFIFVNPNKVHKSSRLTSEYRGFAVLIPVDVVSRLVDFDTTKLSGEIPQERIDERKAALYDLLIELNEYSHLDRKVRVLAINACILKILFLLFSDSESVPENPQTEDFTDLNSSIYTQYINEHYKEPLSLLSVAKHFGFSSSYFSRVFREKTGRNFYTYLSALRLSTATCLLERTSDSIEEISDACGFSSSRSFIQLFTKVNGVTPKHYRDTCHENTSQND